jgi:di/tricarboxylate transporter
MSAPVILDPQPAAPGLSPSESNAPRPRDLLRIVPPILIPIVFWFLPLNLEPKAQHAIAISLFMILGWATEMMDHGLTGLVGCYLFWALKIVTFDVAFSGFANDTPWFLMGAILFCVMAQIGSRETTEPGHTADRDCYSRLLLALIVSGFLLTFLVPSGMAR